MGLLKKAGEAAGSKGKPEPERDEKGSDHGKKNVHKHVPKNAAEADAASAAPVSDDGSDAEEGDGQQAAGPQDMSEDDESGGGQQAPVVQGDSDGQPGDQGGQKDDADADGDEGAQGGSPDGDADDAPQGNADPETGQQTPEGGDQETGTPGSPADDQGGGPAQGVDLSQIPLPPALKEEYMRANAALYTAIYKNDNVANALLKGIQPSGPHKVESIVHSTVLLVTNINKQLRFVPDAPQIVLPFTQDVVSHVIDLAQQVKGIQFSEQEAHAALGASVEAIMRVFGVAKKHTAAMKAHIPRSQLQQGAGQYQQLLQSIKGVKEAAGPGPIQGPQPGGAGGPPGAGGPLPQGGAPAGGPPPGGPPQGGGGGMLSQAAAAGGGEGGEEEQGEAEGQ